MRSNNKQHEILQAAFAVVAEQGANRLTMDAVAAESCVSKGGVLYHFRSKKALLSGMLDYLVVLVIATHHSRFSLDAETTTGTDRC